jgi:hypothetical protein
MVPRRRSERGFDCIISSPRGTARMKPSAVVSNRAMANAWLLSVSCLLFGFGPKANLLTLGILRGHWIPSTWPMRSRSSRSSIAPSTSSFVANSHFSALARLTPQLLLILAVSCYIHHPWPSSTRGMPDLLMRASFRLAQDIRRLGGPAGSIPQPITWSRNRLVPCSFPSPASTMWKR